MFFCWEMSANHLPVAFNCAFYPKKGARFGIFWPKMTKKHRFVVFWPFSHVSNLIKLADWYNLRVYRVFLWEMCANHLPVVFNCTSCPQKAVCDPKTPFWGERGARNSPVSGNTGAPPRYLFHIKKGLELRGKIKMYAKVYWTLSENRGTKLGRPGCSYFLAPSFLNSFSPAGGENFRFWGFVLPKPPSTTTTQHHTTQNHHHPPPPPTTTTTHHHHPPAPSITPTTCHGTSQFGRRTSDGQTGTSHDKLSGCMSRPNDF